MDSFEDYSSHIKQKPKQQSLRKIVDKRMVEAFDQCASAHIKLQENIIFFKDFVDEVTTLYRFYLKWSSPTKNIKVQIDSIESQVTQLAKTYDLSKDKDG